ncbi:MAG: hypothetical protein PHU49_07995 [Syntrophorhabdaceae bacterium]|nr:hypothetical protein [Syntrophorhabdaceae bacterium]MDD5243945.1 hypothetical protein [Syntrophorhabdaceae bacterium]
MESIIESLSKQPAEPKIEYPSMEGQGIESVELPAEPNRIYEKMPAGTKEILIKDFPWQASKALHEAFKEGPTAFAESLSHWTGAAQGAEVFDKGTMQKLDELQRGAVQVRHDSAALGVVFNKVIELLRSLKMEKRG